MVSKVCSKCTAEKDISLFVKGKKTKSGERGLHPWCRECRTEYARQRRVRFPEKVKGYDAEYQAKNRLHINEVQRVNHADRRATDPNFRLSENLRNRLNSAISKEWKAGSAVEDLGVSIPEFRSYLESKFQPGMTWDNWGRGPDKWHIDHVIPLSRFDLTNRQHLLLACNYLNLQPLWETENLMKGNRYGSCHNRAA